MEAEKTIVVGLDGAHYEIMEPWIEEGNLPNIEKLREEANSADLLSVYPPVTAPNWKCYSTGLNPAKIGIFWWENIDVEERSVYPPTPERKNRKKEVWNYLSEENYRCDVIGMPTTYPPKEINGKMVSGGGDAMENGFTHPDALEFDLFSKFDYKVHPKSTYQQKDQFVEEIHEMIGQRFEVALDMLENDNPDFLHVTTFYINVLQHFFWRDGCTKEGWRIIDEYLGKFMEKEDVNLIVMSDHGSNEIKRSFNINTWLHEQGYLSYNLEYRFSSLLRDLGIDKRSLADLLGKLKIKSVVGKFTPDRVKDSIPNEQGELKKKAKMDKIDWEKSKAVASGHGLVYLIDKDIKDELKAKLGDLEYPDGTPIGRSVYEKEEIYEGECMNEAPDLIIDQSRNTHIFGSIGKSNVFGDEGKWAAENKKEGLVMMKGPDIPEKGLEAPSILDLAPTILEIYDIEVPKEMDGDSLLN